MMNQTFCSKCQSMTMTSKISFVELKLLDVNPYKYDNMESGVTKGGSNYHVSEDGIFKHCGEYILIISLTTHMHYSCNSPALLVNIQ